MALSLTTQELIEHLAAAGLSRDRVQVRGDCIVIRGKEDIAIAIEAARVTFPAEAPEVDALPTASKRRRSRHQETGD